MAARRGSELIIRRGDGQPSETFTAIGAVQSSTLDINGNPIEVTTGDDVDGNNEIWQTFITGPKNFSLQARGIAKSTQPLQNVYDDFATGALTNYEIVIPQLGTFTISMIVGAMSFEGPYDGVASFDVTLQAAAAPTTFVAEV